MLEYMENISQSEAENIRKTIQDLFRQTCILQTKCDPVTLIQKDNPHYQVCARNREFIADYLQVLDCELVHDPQEHFPDYRRWRADGAYDTFNNETGDPYEIDLSG